MFWKKNKKLQEFTIAQTMPGVDYTHLNAKTATERSKSNEKSNLDFWINKTLRAVYDFSRDGSYVARIRLDYYIPQFFLPKRGIQNLIEALKDKGFKVGYKESEKELVIEWGPGED